mgnify:CR=1 FL=1
MLDWLESNTFMNVPAYQWLTTLVVIVGSYLILRSVWKLALRKLTEISSRSTTHVDDAVLEVLRSTQKITFAFFSLLIGLHFLDLPQKWESRLDHLSFFVIGLQIAIWLSKCITVWAQMQLLQKEGAPPNPVITSMLSWIFKIGVWSILLLTILSNVGVNITAFVASLGVGGVAVALAVQSILSDLFASLAIGLDKPFVIGDFVVFGEVAGSIERIGLKTTHIRSISGEQIVCSNTELLKNTIHNYKRMSERRVVFKFGVIYDTDPALLAKIPGIVQDAIAQSENTRFDRAHFQGFGTSSLDFEVVYFINSSDFNLYMDTQQAINLYMMTEFRKLGVWLALPATSLYVPKMEEISKALRHAPSNNLTH